MVEGDMSAWGDHMTARRESVQREADSSGVSPVSIGASSRAKGVVALGPVTTVSYDDVARRRADDLDAEAAYYRHRAIQEERALGPGYYVDLLRRMATDRAALAQRIRTWKRAPQKSG
jgi:hypothetical protein